MVVVMLMMMARYAQLVWRQTKTLFYKSNINCPTLNVSLVQKVVEKISKDEGQTTFSWTFLPCNAMLLAILIRQGNVTQDQICHGREDWRKEERKKSRSNDRKIERTDKRASWTSRRIFVGQPHYGIYTYGHDLYMYIYLCTCPDRHIILTWKALLPSSLLSYCCS